MTAGSCRDRRSMHLAIAIGPAEFVRRRSAGPRCGPILTERRTSKAIFSYDPAQVSATRGSEDAVLPTIAAAVVG
jgi:hypothetical protein